MSIGRYLTLLFLGFSKVKIILQTILFVISYLHKNENAIHLIFQSEKIGFFREGVIHQEYKRIFSLDVRKSVLKMKEIYK